MPVPQDPTPDVTIRITGLFLLHFDKRRKHCQVGAVNTDDHEIRIRIKKGRGPESQSEQVRTIPRELLRQFSDLWLGVEVEGEPVSDYGTAELFIVGARDKPPTDPQDYRRVPTFDGFYKRPLKPKAGALTSILVITDGLFYTDMLSEYPYRTLTVTPSGVTKRTTADHYLGYKADVVGVDIRLTRLNESLVLRAGQNGMELLRLKKEPGVTYQITLENGDKAWTAAHHDFDYYRKAFHFTPEEPKILIEPCGLPIAGGGRVPPCGPVDLDRTDILPVEVDQTDVFPGCPNFEYYCKAFHFTPEEPEIRIESCGLPVAGGGIVPPCGPVDLNWTDILPVEVDQTDVSPGASLKFRNIASEIGSQC